MSIVQAVDYHVPVMLEECLEGMNLQPTGHYVDVTFGGGGHSRAILDRLSDGGISTPSTKIPMLRHELRRPSASRSSPRTSAILSASWTTMRSWGKVDALLADLGVSSHHFDDMERGFSFRERRHCWICA